MKTAVIKKEGLIYAIELYENGVYQCTDYTYKKSHIKPHLKTIGYKL